MRMQYCRMDANDIIEVDNFDICPVCDSLVAKNTLEQHVEAHFKDQDGNDAERESYPVAHSNDYKRPKMAESSFQSEVKVNEVSDEMLAQILQQEEQDKMERQEQKEKEEFQRLQHVYGMNSKSGYTKQYGKSLEKDVSRNKMSVAEYYANKGKLLDSLLSGEESGESCTTGIISHLQQKIKEQGLKPNHYIRLCCSTDHYASSYGDKGWGCGYRNLQMLLSGLIKLERYRDVITKVCHNVPSIPVIQQLIEDAWHHGFDQQGAAQLGHKLTKTKKWIGATEIAVVLRYIGLRALIVDFHQPTAPDATHPELFAWIKRYFSKDESPTPVYIQHQGHSRLIVGFEERYTKTGTQHLIIFDPSHSPKQMQQLLSSEKKRSIDYSLLRKTFKQMKSKQYQLVYVNGVMSMDEKEANKVLRSSRIP